MSLSQTPLETALCALLTADTGAGKLMSIVSGVYNMIAPSAATFPFVVFNLVDDGDVYTLTQRIRTRYRYQIKCVDKGFDNKVAVSAMSRIDTLLNRQTLTVTGFTFWVCERIGGRGYVETDAGVPYQHQLSDYVVMVSG